MKPFPLFLILLAVGLGFAGPRINAQEPPPPAEASDALAVPPLAVPERTLLQRSRSRSQDTFALGGNVVLLPGETTRDLFVVGGSAEILGSVTSDLVVILGNVKLGPTAEVHDDLTVIGGVLETHPDAKIRGDKTVIGGTGSHWEALTNFKWMQNWFNAGLLWARPLPHQYAWSWAVAGVFLLIYLVVSLLFPRSVQASVQVLEQRPGSSFLVGLLAFALFFPLLILLAVTVIGLVLVPFLVCGMVAAFFLGRTAVYRYAGHQAGGQLGGGFMQSPLIALILGAALFFLLYTIPVLGLVAWAVIAPLGLGAVLLAFIKSVRSEAGNGRSPEPVAVMLTVPAAPGESAAAPSTVALPRVGFWLRCFATAIDAALVGLLIALLDLPPGALIVVWAGYHLGLWAWKGTTVGGMVFSLKIVRANGRPIDFSVALVRLLAAFVSAAVLLLGFFWAGWSAERQSWHDKIAGTYIVQLPRGMSVV